jgi:outer membrane protein OmpA-like peptidoglycan-associated protein
VSRLIPLLFAICSLLLTACATTAVPDTLPDHDSPDAEARSEPEWLATRARLDASLSGVHGIDIQAMDDGAMLLRLPAAEGFPRNSAEPTRTLQTMLDKVASVLDQAPATTVKVLGHTDSLGSELYNLELSIRRAEAVMEYLRARGIDLVRLRADGRGEAEPIADNATAAGRAINRRVEIVVRPMD